MRAPEWPREWEYDAAGSVASVSTTLAAVTMSILRTDPYVSITSSIGADLIATFFALILYGVSLHQLYRYCRTFTDDLFIRGLVFTVFLLETAHAAMTMHYTYFFVVTNFFDPRAIQNGVWSVNLSTVFAALIVISSQLFFVRRIYMIGYQYRIIASIAMLLLISEIPISIYVVQHLFGPNLEEGISQTQWFTGALCLLPTLVDTILTYTLISVLRRSRAGLKRNDGFTDLIIIYVVNTGLLHWVLNLSAFIAFVVVKDKFTNQSYGAITIVTGRIYMTTFLCVLNSRDTRRSVAVFEGGSYGLNLIERATRRAAAETYNVPAIAESEPATINVKVATEIVDGQAWSGIGKTLDHVKTSDCELACSV